ncbi:4Fe-4S dicluster domain-containing protein [Candidatus Formimonas warabiya]|uniref:4Fe-4S ferredoxin-type domain-containing protein n=1 Tax=Formimonas warabiya TaxID=1761012 RepID=A0A3G1KRB2_FORW1|nr:4Fe-4S binding protein [Candidatus Formimonas warabiya]ATW24998.1 hypothetical protein DCMF_09615 [Candidatus Formimonas warabiya]
MAVKSIDYNRCSGCHKCWDICPMDVYRLAGKEVYIAYQADCMSCYLCELLCPQQAIHVSPERGQPKPLPW